MKPTVRLTIRKMLEASTAHLTPDLNIPGALKARVSGVYENDYGYLLWVPDNPLESSNAQEEPDPACVLEIRLCARRLGCDYVLLDTDAPLVDCLPVYDDDVAAAVAEAR